MTTFPPLSTVARELWQSARRLRDVPANDSPSRGTAYLCARRCWEDHDNPHVRTIAFNALRHGANVRVVESDHGGSAA